MYDRSFMEGTRGTMAVDWEERVDTGRLRRERKERALERLQDSDLGSMLLIDDPNVRYVTGPSWGGRRRRPLGHRRPRLQPAFQLPLA
jgi:hypothetical protein